GEHIFIGQLGHSFVILSLVFSLLASLAFLYSRTQPDFISFARICFKLHSASIIGIAATLFFMLFNHYFEYQYVWQHSNREMDMKYILSCFWEGQEGSFLLWSFWNVVLGLLFNRSIKNTEWEAPSMSIFSLVQVFLASMLLGVYILDYKLGSSPFLLLREHSDFKNLPFVQSANYLEKLNGRGLNPLLMNYWMTIHPPTLFLGFASTLIPFVYAVAAFWNKKFDQWQANALPWTFFSVLVLGVGILMGGAWAYEALSFGGFWAWDPVENSSLVPWLVIVGAGHTMIINKNKKGSLFSTHLLSICGFLLVLYSTFLTRSGILGNASVHAFTDLGMQGQLVIYMLAFVLISVALLIQKDIIRSIYVVTSLLLWFFTSLYGFKTIGLYIWIATSFGLTIYSYLYFFPKEKEEEPFLSREFWLFLGSVVLLFTALILTYFTSLPVINKLFNSNYAQLKVAEYNQFILPFAIIIAILIGAAQFLKYKKTEAKDFLKSLRYSIIASILFGGILCIPLFYNEMESFGVYDKIGFSLLFVFSIFGVIGNIDYTLRVLKGKIKKAGSSIAHIGFSLILIGALISTSKKQTISKNTSSTNVKELGEDFNDQRSILLTKGDTLPMGPYMVTYNGKEKIGMDVFFHVDYLKPDKDGKPILDFSLAPKVQDNPRMGKAADPDTKHYLNRDIYTHVTYADLSTTVDSTKLNKYSEATNYVGHIKDSIIASNAIVIIDSLRTNVSENEYQQNDSLLEVTAVLKAMDKNGLVYFARPTYTIKNNMSIPGEFELEELGLKFVFWKINPEEGSVEITMSERAGNTKDFIVMEAHIFPFINVLWLGCIVMALGTFLAILERIRKTKNAS
ncbi:MAG: cytochrome c biogenesis protein CcsA, partial [Flavobacteriales bacterium]|nr:cytochrome c biogenesis protein CcsA [Flavobacteriales bacterium]